MANCTDLYGNTLSTGSQAAAEAYNTGLHRLLAAQVDMVAPFEHAIALDSRFALAHVGLARALLNVNDGPGARKAIVLIVVVAAATAVTDHAGVHSSAAVLVPSGTVTVTGGQRQSDRDHEAEREEMAHGFLPKQVLQG